MPGVADFDRPPKGLDAEWLGRWRLAHKRMRELGVWAPAMAPLLAEYVYALEEADRARRAGESTSWDRAAKRASALGDQLALTPRGLRAAGLDLEDPEPDPFSHLDGTIVPLRRPVA